MSEIPMPSYENMSPAELGLITARGVNALIAEVKKIQESLHDFEHAKEKVDNCPHCQHPEVIRDEIAAIKQAEAKGKLFFVLLIAASTGAGSGITKLVEALSK